MPPPPPTGPTVVEYVETATPTEACVAIGPSEVEKDDIESPPRPPAPTDVE